ncbi:MAG: ATP-binding protein [Candidatus Dormibacteraceae bacterium]
MVRIYAEVRGSRVRIWFQDNGIGIAEDFTPQLFGIFQRGTNQFPGNGLGLALVKRVIERMGGQVGVESEPAKGSRFWIELKADE